MAVALAAVVPWLVYRDLAPLLVSRTTLAGLTPAAQLILRQRQGAIQTIQDLLPWIAPLVFAVGVGLIGWGGNRMRHAQHWEDRGLRARTQQEEASIRPQTESERQERIAEEVEEATSVSEEAASISASLTPSPLSTSVRRPRRSTSSRASEVLAIQEEVLDRVEAILPAGCSFEREVVVSQGVTRLSLDGLVKSAQSQGPDVLIETKVFRGFSSIISRAADQVIAMVVRYRDMTRRHATGWLILVYTDKAPPESYQQRIRATLGNYGSLSVISRDQIEDLGIPDQDTTRSIR